MALESYNPESVPKAEKEEKTQQELAELAQDVQDQQEKVESQETADTPQEASPESNERAAEQALERNEMNEQATERLDGNEPTEGKIKLELVKDPATVAYIEQSGNQELQDQYEALAVTTQEEIDRVLESQGEVQETATGQAEG